MKNVFKILIALTALSFLSCSGSDDDNSKYLTFELGSKSGILIPKPAVTSSCEQLAKGQTSSGSVTGAYFELGNPTFKWTLEDTSLSEVRIVALKLSIKSPKVGGDYSCVFSDVALGSLYYKSELVSGNYVYSFWNGGLGTTGATTLLSTNTLISKNGFTACNLKCGGVNILDKAGQFSVNGTWEVFGVQKRYKTTEKTDYEEFPLKTQGEFTVENVIN